MRFLWFLIGVAIVGCLAGLGWQVVTEPMSLILIVVGTILLVSRRSEQRRGSSRMFAGIFITIGITMNSAFWGLFVLTFLALLLFLATSAGGVRNWVPWRQKQYVHFKTTAPQDNEHSQLQRSPWFGDHTIGTTTFPWDDINFVALYGDTIIDLGNTLLPEDQDNTIMIRKGVGRTRILVPVGVDVELDHSALYGKVQFLDDHYQLQNERLQVHHQEKDGKVRTIKIVTSVLIGDLEVRYV
ncbi:cell wall-active antibiotics response protein LiaF [Schleiferilactobacillus perolens]|uniref:cell wall-active antibiotics response protein LiaF n=1 Tax=Schleiferilactobacillus perolens TaxID=100468 RepID=UPI0007102E6A|nr:cell wall-active antibiotics response protein LiaF [Schleiferilactobacillus perolens]MCI2171866.1 cell wall-active antibiotics response protein LiaF [Schleiferilactobacillus perolens]